MPSFASSEKAPAELYQTIIGSVVPRPVAFVSTKGADGVANLAPYSFFNGVTFNPPTLAFSVIDRGAARKDTSRNLAERPELIVHIVSESLAERMNVTSGEYGAHVDEFVEAGFAAVPGTVVDVPRVAEALVAMECRVSHHLRLGDSVPRSSHILAEVLHWHLDERVLTPRGRVDPSLLRAVGRMGGEEYTRTRDRFAMKRPVVAADDPRAVATKASA